MILLSLRLYGTKSRDSGIHHWDFNYRPFMQNSQLEILRRDKATFIHSNLIILYSPTFKLALKYLAREKKICVSK